MSRLVPEKRQDRNGRWVTRHVRAANAPSAALPAPPAPGAPAAGLSREVRGMVVRAWDAIPTHSLVKASGLPSDVIFSFDASAAQVYEVCAVTRSAMDAAVLLSCGARTGAAARAYAQSVGEESVLGEGTAEAALIALEQGVSPERFLMHYDLYRDAVADPSAAVDAIRFRALVLGDYGYAQEALARGIAEGKISYAHLEHFQPWHLRKEDTALLLSIVLPRIASGEAKCSLDDVYGYVDDADELDSEHFGDLAQVLAHADVARLPEGTMTYYLCRAFRRYRHDGWTGGRFGDAEAAERAVYFMAIWPRSGNSQIAEAVNGFFEAGVPADLAAEVYAAGGTPQQALAIWDGSAPRGLSSGAL